MSRLLAAIALCVLAAALSFGTADAKISTTEVPGQALADSMGTAADTLTVTGKKVAGRIKDADALWLEAVSDSAMVVVLEIANSPADSSRWFEAARDTVAAGTWKKIDLDAKLKGKLYRVILDNLGGGPTYGDVDLVGE